MVMEKEGTATKEKRSSRGDFTRGTTPTLRLGVTGPTEVADEPLQGVMDEILAAISASAGHAQLVVVTCLAAGTDQIVARMARERGAEIWAIVPSRVESYASRMSKEARSRFVGLSKAAAVVLELDLPLPDGDAADLHAQRQKAYEGANLVMLEQSDLLIAAVNPADERKSGGAADTVAHALALSMPVALIELGQTPLRWEILQGDDPAEFRDRLSLSQSGRLLQNLPTRSAGEVDSVIKRILDLNGHGT